MLFCQVRVHIVYVSYFSVYVCMRARVVCVCVRVYACVCVHVCVSAMISGSHSQHALAIGRHSHSPEFGAVILSRDNKQLQQWSGFH